MSRTLGSDAQGLATGHEKFCSLNKFQRLPRKRLTGFKNELLTSTFSLKSCAYKSLKFHFDQNSIV